MVRSSVRVVLRTRPSQVGNRNLSFGQDGRTVSISVNKAQDLRSGLPVEKQGQQYQFKFDSILNSSTQDDVYQTCGEEALKSALQGFNSTIMCYGQTGAGKTFTMSGGKADFKQRGLIPRVLGQLFAEAKAQRDREAEVSVQYLEIYNENLYDLLDVTTQPHEINIFEDSKGLVTIQGLRNARVGSEAEALQMLFEGETNRVIGEHQLNRESSRSHSIFMITLKTKMHGDTGETVVSKVNLVDLAGSERVSKTKSEGMVLKEAGHINKSLSILEQVILAASEKNRDHVPFRSSKLTHVLKDSLGGNCKTVLIANVWGDPAQTDETLSTCRLAQRMMMIQCEVKANVVEDNSAKSRMLQRVVNELQQELAMHDIMVSRKDVVYGPYNESQRNILKEQVLHFLDLGTSSPPEDLSPLDLLSVRHMREILRACKEAYQDLKAKAAGGGIQGPSDATQNGDHPMASPTDQNVTPASAQPGAENTDMVGEVEAQNAMVQSGGVGVAPEDGEAAVGGAGSGDEDGGASAMERLLAMQQGAAADSGRGPGAGQDTSQGVASPSGRPLPSLRGPAPDRHQALEDYKMGPGQSTASLLAENKAKLKMVRRKAKELGLSINQAKRELDNLKRRADELKSYRMASAGDAAAVMGAEEYDAVLRIKELKQDYRDQFSELQMVRSEVDYTQQLCEACTKELVTGFKAWYLSHYGAALDDGGDDLGDDGDDVASTLSPTNSTASSAFNTGSLAGTPAGRMQAHRASGLNNSSATSSPSTGAGSQRVGSNLNQSQGGKGRPAPIPGGATVGGKPPEDMMDPDAAAYYSAQQMMAQRTTGAAARQPGSQRKNAPATGFGTTSRALTDKK